MTDLTELRRLAEAVIAARAAAPRGRPTLQIAEALGAFRAAADPQTVLGLLDENRDLRERVEQLVEYLHDIRTAKHPEDAHDLISEAIEFAKRPIIRQEAK